MKKFYLQKEDYFGRDIRVFYREQHGNSGHAYAQSVTMKYIADEDAQGQIMPAMMTITPECAQNLMDSLWDLGFRPSEGTGSAGAMAATQKHLEDMRKLVFSPSSVSTKKDGGERV